MERWSCKKYRKGEQWKHKKTTLVGKHGGKERKKTTRNLLHAIVIRNRGKVVFLPSLLTFSHGRIVLLYFHPCPVCVLFIPGHFLISHPLQAITDPSSSYQLRSLSWWCNPFQALTWHFCWFWSIKYLCHLWRFTKWSVPFCKLHVDDIVCLYENHQNLPNGHRHK